MNNFDHIFNSLLTTVNRLRGEGGCPWDRKQSAESMRKYLLAETNELIAAIDNKDAENICEEIGDLLFIIILLSKIHEDAGLFNLQDVIAGIDEKLVRRHPHVFAGASFENEEQLRAQWKAIKAQEKGKKSV